MNILHIGLAQRACGADGRAVSNLSRTLKTMERHGLVTLGPGSAREIRSRVTYDQIDLSLSIR